MMVLMSVQKVNQYRQTTDGFSNELHILGVKKGVLLRNTWWILKGFQKVLHASFYWNPMRKPFFPLGVENSFVGLVMIIILYI